MGYGDFQIRIFSSSFCLPHGPGFFADRAKVITRIPIFTKELIRKIASRRLGWVVLNYERDQVNAG